MKGTGVFVHGVNYAFASPSRAAFAILLFLVGAGVLGGAAELTSGDTETIALLLNRSRVLTAPWPVDTISITEPKIADVEVLRTNLVQVKGKSVGTTDLILLGKEEGQIQHLRISIDFDLNGIKGELANLFPDAELDIRQASDAIMITGSFARADQPEQMRHYLTTLGVKYLDMTSLSGVQQVQVQVRIAEASRTALRALGMSALMGGHHDNTFFGATQVGTASGGALTPISIGPPAGAPAGPEGVPFEFNADVRVSPLVTLLAGFPRADLEFFIQALAENAYLRLLAEPNLVALSGETASFLAGGEFPIPVAQGGTVGSTAITIEYKEFGVRLTFRPTVLGDNRIRMYVAPEVSNLSDQGAVEQQGFRIPAINTRRAETTVELHSGETFAMAGLLQNTSTARNTRIPLLGDLPVLGALFRSVRYERGETELLVMVTATLVEPMTSESTPPLPGTLHTVPNDWEFYFLGKIEGQSPAITSPNAARLKDAGLDQLRGPGAWARYDVLPGERQVSAVGAKE